MEEDIMVIWMQVSVGLYYSHLCTPTNGVVIEYVLPMDDVRSHGHHLTMTANRTLDRKRKIVLVSRFAMITNFAEKYADFQTHLTWISLNKQQTHAPFGTIHRALDVGCGTGLWAIDFGENHPIEKL